MPGCSPASLAGNQLSGNGYVLPLGCGHSVAFILLNVNKGHNVITSRVMYF